MRPDKGNGVVLIDVVDYKKQMDELFSDSNKFKHIDSDPTNTRLKTVQSYLSTLLSRNEITKGEYKALRPKCAKPARAHGLPTIHKTYQNLPKFRPIIDTNGATHYQIGQYLTNLLSPLTVSQYSLKDSFDAANKIRDIPPELFENDYKFV